MTATGAVGDEQAMTIYDLIEHLKIDEGFRAKPYQDTLGNWTFGHGFTWISEPESEVILRMRVDSLRADLMQADLFRGLSDNRQKVLLNMAFNLGLTGLYRFKKMWLALMENDYTKASQEMMASNWAVQVGKRADRLAKIMKEG